MPESKHKFLLVNGLRAFFYVTPSSHFTAFKGLQNIAGSYHLRFFYLPCRLSKKENGKVCVPHSANVCEGKVVERLAIVC